METETERIIYTVTPPPRCSYYRAATWWEIVKFLLLGPERGFDPEHERRCNHYAGHSQFGYPHETMDGTRWWKD